MVSARNLLFHLPLTGMLLILGVFALINEGILASFRNESTFGWMLVVWYPIAVLLGLAQLGLWIYLFSKRIARPGKNRTGTGDRPSS